MALHHRWLTIDGIQFAKLSQSFLLAANPSFLETDFAKCHGSNWWSLLTWFTLISFLIWGCLSVDMIDGSTPLASTFCSASRKPLISMTFALVTWETLMTLKSTTFWLSTSNSVYVQYLAQWPGESHRPSPARAIPTSLDFRSSNTVLCSCSQVFLTTGKTYFFLRLV